MTSWKMSEEGHSQDSKLRFASDAARLVLESSGGFELLGAENIYYWALLRLCRLLLGTKGSYDAKMSLPNSSYT